MWFLEKIPKIVHFYWGEPILPWLRFITIQSFMLNNPDWEVRYYYPTEYYKPRSWVSFEQKYELTGKNYFYLLQELGVKRIPINFYKRFQIPNNISEVHKSDYLRWYLLSKVGGLWSDMDIVYFKNINEMSLNVGLNKEVNTIVCNNVYGNSIGFMLSSPNNPYYKVLWDRAISNFDPNNYQSVGSILVNKEFPSVKTISERLPECIVRNLSMDTVYAYNAKIINTIYDSCDLSYLRPGSIGVHWYAGHPKAEKLINEVTGDNYFIYPSNVILETTKYGLWTKVIETIYKLIPENGLVLDVGCGNKELSNKIKKGKIVTLDVWSKFKPDVIHNLEQTPLPFLDNTFDVILLIDVIEHLDKNMGLKLLEDLKRITKKYIIVLTPLWWTDNHENVDDKSSAYYGNQYNRHKSLWAEEDFRGWSQLQKIGYLEKYFVGFWVKK